MITQIIREALLDSREIIPGYVYVVRDSDMIFYVGISSDPTFRLAQHLGIADGWNYSYSPEKLISMMEHGPVDDTIIGQLMPAQLGQCILEHAPASLKWSFDIYEKPDAIAVLERTGYMQRYPGLAKMMKGSWYRCRADVERALIEDLKPLLNDQLIDPKTTEGYYTRQQDLDNSPVYKIDLNS